MVSDHGPAVPATNIQLVVRKDVPQIHEMEEKMSILMDGKDCRHCACCHFTNKNKDTLFCVKLGSHPRMNDYCGGFERSTTDEKLVLTAQFIHVLKLLGTG